jgi:oligopeptidase B
MEKEYYLPFESETYTPTSNVDFDDILRYAYQSMATPASIIDFNMKTREKVIRKEQEVLGGSFDKDNYIEERVWAAKMELRCLFLWFIKGLKRWENPLCFMPMVHMVIPWMPIFHQQDYPYSTEVLFMPLRTFEVVKI